MCKAGSRLRSISSPQLRRLAALIWLANAVGALAKEGSMQRSRSAKKNGGARGVDRDGGQQWRVDVTAVAHAHFAAHVRGELAGLGVDAADLPDVCQEVFLVVQAKAHVAAVIDRLDLWLRAICRRVVAGHRPRAAHRNIA
jgi:hypothetical protein